MKNKLKFIIILIFAIILSSSITAYAVLSYSAKDITFTSTNNNWNPENLEDAINDLYKNINCVTGTMHHPANANLNFDFGFVPKKFLISMNNIGNFLYINYDSDVSNSINVGSVENTAFTNTGYNMKLTNNILTSNYPKDFKAYKNEFDMYYVACK